MTDVDTETGQQRHRLGIATGTSREPSGSRDRGELRHAPAVVRHHDRALGLGDDEYPRRSCTRRLTGMAPQPIGLLRGLAFEAIELVVTGEQFGRAVAPGHSTKGEGRSIKR